MSSSTAARGSRRTTSSRGGRSGSPRTRGAAARRTVRARRMRRRLGWFVTLGALAVLVAVMLPLAKRAVVTEFGLPLQYAGTIRQQAAEKHVPPALIAAVIYAETKFVPRTSPTGAEGLMQVEPQTALDLAKRSGATAFSVSDLQHPATNIAYGTYYLRELLNEYHGSKLLALAAYNGGETNVNRWEAQARAHGHDLTIAEIPFPETRAYVAKVLGAERRYARTYPRQLGYR
ncbi:MAG TPA: lytic transglycosylase domain-containing protein [Solirubrobacteraceae bacterium]|nr:lytic transglycosylase domain-containing protein [Solirubrobacteraceae bacterium]